MWTTVWLVLMGLGENNADSGPWLETMWEPLMTVFFDNSNHTPFYVYCNFIILM